jgi:hypothetical protein
MKQSRLWTTSDLERLKLLASQGASAARAAAALNRKIASVRSQARKLAFGDGPHLAGPLATR